MKNRVYLTSEDGLYMTGVCEPFKFSAKVYGSPSEYGIDGSRVSKLTIYSGDGFPPVVNYDRGWDIKPKTETQKDALRDILEALENPQDAPALRAVWKNGQKIGSVTLTRAEADAINEKQNIIYIG